MTTSGERLAGWLRPAFYLGRNAFTFVGAVLTTSAAMTLLGFWALLIVKGGAVHPYTGIVFFLILPAVFAAGLVLMPFGMWWRRRSLARRGTLPAEYPRVDPRDPMLRRLVVAACTATFLNVVILGTATYQAVDYMDSPTFCGQTCHTVMGPEFTSYQASAHARVPCVSCHIGPGASWFIRSKLAGVRQVFAVTFDSYDRPIPTPVRDLRPARDTCQGCHWPQKFHGDKLLVHWSYDDDEASTPQATALVLKIGGRTWQGKTGIHGRHLDDFDRITYVATDDRRQVIPLVTYIDDDGHQVEYVSTDATASRDDLARLEHRTMDCMDCHNRPTHTLRMPVQAVDEVITSGEIDRSLPFLKKEAVALVSADYASHDEAAAQIPARLRDFYRTDYPEVLAQKERAVEAAGTTLARVYNANVFPEMKVGWGTYPNNIGHEFFPGCFRCHDGLHATADGRTISGECDTCHRLLAVQDPDPDILKQLAGD